MFHISSLGGFGYQVKDFADLDGYVPEPGDRPSHFRWDEFVEWDRKTWSEFVARARKKTDRALQGLSLWQDAS
ncbi:hypothetical protein [Phormidium sp. CCY1219]|uniref:hypothetical protein n=1 Tax=Phormidium sp. CCY1219 TaxID=2886104 RepID=UPI002D1EF46A|nr:hypothetical protein [Phormidium sp. CCY1219]MEB3826623.1 hypothetical protein [Phormidium sp. CCY1219]